MTDEIKIPVPDIGGASNVDVIEILVQVGDNVSKEQSLITLEGDKATMDIPSPHAGRVQSIAMVVGDKVSQGDLILTLAMSDNGSADEKVAPLEPLSEPAIEVEAAPAPAPAPVSLSEESVPTTRTTLIVPDLNQPLPLVSAGPAVRRLARELGVDLTQVTGTGLKKRITTQDIHQYVKQRLNEPSGAAGWNIPSMPEIDFTPWGDVTKKPLNKIKRLTGSNLHRSWITVPHVTQFDEADITELEAFRKMHTDKTAQKGYKLTLLAFITRVVCKALMDFPQFNASLDPSGEHLIYKQYYNVGIAVETPNGLVVPVIKAVNTLSVMDIAEQMAQLSKKARDKALTPADMMGGCFTISSLGGIGGTAFTPIVNAPEVAILGLSRSSIKPVYINNAFEPRLMLPLSLSYDHRVIDGAEAARFTRAIADMLSDIRQIIL